MYIYNVTIKLEKQIQQDWIKWMQEIHIPEVLATGKFTDARLSQLIEPKNDEGDTSYTYVAQYFADSLEDYTAYIDEHATLLRQKGFDQFGNQFIGFRSLLKSII